MNHQSSLLVPVKWSESALFVRQLHFHPTDVIVVHKMRIQIVLIKSKDEVKKRTMFFCVTFYAWFSITFFTWTQANDKIRLQSISYSLKLHLSKPQKNDPQERDSLIFPTVAIAQCVIDCKTCDATNGYLYEIFRGINWCVFAIFCCCISSVNGTFGGGLSHCFFRFPTPL